MKRREFFTKTGLGLGGLVFTSQFGCAHKPQTTESKPRFYDPYERVALGNTGLKFSRFCMGTGVRGGNRQSNHTRMGKENLEALFNQAYDRGVRWFDLADLYGTHPYLIPALRTMPRDRYGIVTKIWFRPGGLPEKERPNADVVVERFLKELKTDYIDLVLLHCVTSGKWNEELQPQMEILAKLRQRGSIRAHGVSCHSLEALQAAAREPWVQSVHARINPYGDSMDGAVEQVVPVLREIKAAGKGLVGMKIVGEGKYRNDEQKLDRAAEFVLKLGCVDLLNIGFEKTEEIDDFALRVRKVAMS